MLTAKNSCCYSNILQPATSAGPKIGLINQSTSVFLKLKNIIHAMRSCYLRHNFAHIICQFFCIDKISIRMINDIGTVHMSIQVLHCNGVWLDIGSLAAHFCGQVAHAHSLGYAQLFKNRACKLYCLINTIICAQITDYMQNNILGIYALG